MSKFHLYTCLILFFACFHTLNAQNSSENQGYLSWSSKTAKSVGKSWRNRGRAGGFFDTRILSTNDSFNYKLRATLMSPEAIRAASRIEQLNNRLSDKETIELVDKAEANNNLVVIVEIDPREGSGVIPRDWSAFLGGKGLASKHQVRGKVTNSLRKNKAFNFFGKRDYDYDIFWVSFSLDNSKWSEIPEKLELSVRIKQKEGRVSWKTSLPLKERLKNILH